MRNKIVFLRVDLNFLMLKKIFQCFFTKLLSILDCNIFKIIILTCINKSNKLNSLSDISIKCNVDFFINFSERSSGKLLVNGRRLHHLVEISISDCCMWIQMTYALIDITFALLLNSSFYVRALSRWMRIIEQLTFIICLL